MISTTFFNSEPLSFSRVKAIIKLKIKIRNKKMKEGRLYV